jgi:ribosome-associated toxin RatA of RatAB toxin-antitoxin module
MKKVFALLALLAALPAWAEALSVRTQRAGDAITVSATVVVGTDVATVWSVLTDYDRYSDFVPDLHASRVRGRDDRGIIVEQTGDARFLFMRQRVDATLAVSEVPFRSVTSVAIGGSFRELSGSYDIAPIEGGTRFSYAGRVVPGEGMPAWLTAVALKWNVERTLRGLVREMDRRAHPERLAQRAGDSLSN